jgi:hypothetical protein
VYDQECLDSPNSYRLHDFQTEDLQLTEGPLTYAEHADQIAANATIINNAIDEVGAETDHSILCLPAGRYDVISPHIHPGIHYQARQTVAISINQSNFTLWGAGRDEGGTHFYSNGEYDLIEDEVFRGHGMFVVNGNSHITLRDFALNGQGALPGDSTAHTGCKNWRSPESRINCWDTSHKGLIVAWGSNTVVDELLVERVAVRSYKGEMIYQGGRGLRKATFREIISEDTNAQAWNVHGQDVLVEDSYFGLSNQWYEIEALWGEGDLNMQGVYRNITHDKCDGAQCISIAQGDNSAVPITFENNYFTGCNFRSDDPGYVLGIAEATGGPFYFKNNELDGCGVLLTIVGGGQFTGPRANIFIEDNDVHSLTQRAFDIGFALENLQVRNNNFTWDSGDNFIRFGWNTAGGIIEDNVLNGEAAPTYHGSGPNMLPIFQNNSWSHGPNWRVQYSTVNPIIMPLYDHHIFATPDNGSDFIAEMNTDIYPDGFTTTIDVRSGSKWDDLVFLPGATSYDVPEEIRLVPGEGQLTLMFDGALGKWVLPE